MVTNQNSRSRSEERGAAVFIVLIVLTMLTAVGVFAMRAASLGTSTSGFERQATQNQAVAECAISVVMNELASDRRDAYLEKLMAGADKCLAAPGLGNGATVPCYRVFANDFGAGNPCAVAATPTGPLVSDFMVELTDPGPGRRMAGSAQGIPIVQVTLTATGQVRPATESADAGATTTGNATTRAYIVVGPRL